MEDTIDIAIMDAFEGFDSVLTTEDQRSGVERRKCLHKEFPLEDANGNIVAEDRRHIPDRRALSINIDDITEYLIEA